MSRFFVTEPVDAVLHALIEALDRVAIGLMLLDRDLRVRFVNRRAIEILDVPPERLAQRPTFRALLSRVMARGRFAVADDDMAVWLDQREAGVRAGTVPSLHIELRDGTRYLFTCHPSADGGRILTYADVSGEAKPEVLHEMQAINAELRFSNETMESQAAYLASLAEATDETARKLAEAKYALEREIGERRQLEARLRQLATTDPLTGALNRAGFLTLAQTTLAHRPATGAAPALMMLDVDHFKAINDHYGHAGGDLALRHLVTLLTTLIRQTDLLGRLGGEEFAILLPSTTPEAAARIAERLVTRVAASKVAYGDRAIAMTISVGVTLVTEADQGIEPVLARADDALYRAKNAGRDQVAMDASVAAALTPEQNARERGRDADTRHAAPCHAEENSARR